MIKKFNQYIKESDMYENTIINVVEYNTLIDERWMQMSANEIEEIGKHINKYSSECDIKIEKYDVNRLDISYLIVSIRKYSRYISFTIVKITDEWFTINLIISTGSVQHIYYKCDEIHGLLNQIDQIIKTYIS
jgi:hypothetical protein